MCFWLLIARRYAVVIPNDCHIRYENIEILNGRIKTHIVSGDRKGDRDRERGRVKSYDGQNEEIMTRENLIRTLCVYHTPHYKYTLTHIPGSCQCRQNIYPFKRRGEFDR